jgi:hypothetical protein
LFHYRHLCQTCSHADKLASLTREQNNIPRFWPGAEYSTVLVEAFTDYYDGECYCSSGKSASTCQHFNTTMSVFTDYKHIRDFWELYSS